MCVCVCMSVCLCVTVCVFISRFALIERRRGEGRLTETMIQSVRAFSVEYHSKYFTLLLCGFCANTHTNTLIHKHKHTHTHTNIRITSCHDDGARRRMDGHKCVYKCVNVYCKCRFVLPYVCTRECNRPILPPPPSYLIPKQGMASPSLKIKIQACLFFHA